MNPRACEALVGEAAMILQVVEISQKFGVGLRFVREMEQGKETLRLDKVNQVLALFGAEMAPMTLSEIQYRNDCFSLAM